MFKLLKLGGLISGLILIFMLFMATLPTLVKAKAPPPKTKNLVSTKVHLNNHIYFDTKTGVALSQERLSTAINYRQQECAVTSLYKINLNKIDDGGNIASYNLLTKRPGRVYLPRLFSLDKVGWHSSTT